MTFPTVCMSSCKKRTPLPTSPRKARTGPPKLKDLTGPDYRAGPSPTADLVVLRNPLHPDRLHREYLSPAQNNSEAYMRFAQQRYAREMDESAALKQKAKKEQAEEETNPSQFVSALEKAGAFMEANALAKANQKRKAEDKQVEEWKKEADERLEAALKDKGMGRSAQEKIEKALESCKDEMLRTEHDMELAKSEYDRAYAREDDKRVWELMAEGLDSDGDGESKDLQHTAAAPEKALLGPDDDNAIEDSDASDDSTEDGDSDEEDDEFAITDLETSEPTPTLTFEITHYVPGDFNREASAIAQRVFLRAVAPRRSGIASWSSTVIQPLPRKELLRRNLTSAYNGVPEIRVTTPRGTACSVIYEEPVLFGDHEEEVKMRDEAQDHMQYQLEEFYEDEPYSVQEERFRKERIVRAWEIFEEFMAKHNIPYPRLDRLLRTDLRKRIVRRPRLDTIEEELDEILGGMEDLDMTDADSNDTDDDGDTYMTDPDQTSSDEDEDDQDQDGRMSSVNAESAPCNRNVEPCSRQHRTLAKADENGNNVPSTLDLQTLQVSLNDATTAHGTALAAYNDAESAHRQFRQILCATAKEVRAFISAKMEAYKEERWVLVERYGYNGGPLLPQHLLDQVTTRTIAWLLAQKIIDQGYYTRGDVRRWYNSSGELEFIFVDDLATDPERPQKPTLPSIRLMPGVIKRICAKIGRENLFSAPPKWQKHQRFTSVARELQYLESYRHQLLRPSKKQERSRKKHEDEARQPFLDSFDKRTRKLDSKRPLVMDANSEEGDDNPAEANDNKRHKTDEGPVYHRPVQSMMDLVCGFTRE